MHLLKLLFFSLFISCSTSLESNGSRPDLILNENMMNEETPLIKATNKRDIDAVKMLLKSQLNLEVKNHKGKTALMIAAYNEDNAIAELLINAGADVNAQDEMLNSPFLYAGAEGNIHLVKLGLANGADFNVFNRYGGSALIPAAEKGHLDIVRILVEVPNYPIDHINNLGWTALMEAVILAKPGQIQEVIIQTLIDAGCDVNIPDFDGVSPLAHAKEKSLNQVAELLEAAGAK